MNIRNSGWVVFASFWILLLTVSAEAADGYTIESIDHLALPGGATQLRVTLDKPVDFSPASFSINKPAKVSFDFPETVIRKKEAPLQLESGVVSTVRAVEAGDRSRLVVGLRTLVPYEVRTESNIVYINFQKQSAVASEVQAANLNATQDKQITELDFRRGSGGEGKIFLKLSDPSTIVNMEQRGTKLVVDIVNAGLPEKLVRRLDVTDFATPISIIDAFNAGVGSKIIVESIGDYEHMAYQAGNDFVIDIKPISSDAVAEKKKDKFGYSGEPLSLNFQNIEVRAVLQLLADFTGLNVVASDTVRGNITLRLKNVPWDQALDIILRTRGLGKRQTGNVLLIAPNAEIAQREKEELEAQKQRVDLAPVYTSYHQINYAKAADIAALLKSEKSSILSDRGSVAIDDRTNTLMVLESAEKHDEISALIHQLDVPVKQVMIESRVVIASDDFGRDIGVRFGVTGRDTATIVGSSADTIAVTGSASGADSFARSGTFPSQGERYNVNLPGSGTGRIGMAILGSSFLVDLELSALQTEGRGEVLSNPRVITSNQETAKISQGVDVPYQEASSSGATSISFKKADLSLEVTPLITPDDRIDMKLKITKNSVGGIYAGVPSIDTREVDTKVLVNNGDTVVLGGIYEESKSQGATKVPFFGDLPLVGALFRTKSNKESKAELLVFVTPKILDEALKVTH